jgi:hypothetical protein
VNKAAKRKRSLTKAVHLEPQFLHVMPYFDFFRFDFIFIFCLFSTSTNTILLHTLKQVSGNLVELFSSVLHFTPFVSSDVHEPVRFVEG